MRFLLLIILFLLGGVAYAWYSSQSLPSWYQSDNDQQTVVVEKLANQINEQGVSRFLGAKFAGVMNGELVLNETEFNALLMASLKSISDGKRLLSVSDGVNAQIQDDRLQLGVVLDLEKVAQLDQRSREAVDKVLQALPFLDKSKMYLAVSGEPVARSGNIGFSDDFSVTIGAIPLSSNLLARLGVPVHKASTASLPLRNITVKSIKLRQDKITMGVLPKF